MIDHALAAWAVSLTDADLRVAYVEALEWLYEDNDGPFPIITAGLTEAGSDDFDEAAAIVMLECAGRWVNLHDGPVALTP